MSIQQAKISITGLNYLLMNNPQTVDPFNKFSKLKKPLTSKKSKTEEDLIELADLDTESKIYFDDELGVYVPTRWLTEQIVTSAYGIIKVSKDKMRGGLFATEDNCKLFYDGMNKVKTIGDVVGNSDFRHRKILPQQQIRIAKDFPIFKNWRFSTIVEFDDSVVDFNGLKSVITRTAKYSGFGDFRPTFGRAEAVIENV